MAKARTAAQRAALRKAQLASARKRHGRRKIAVGLAVGAGVAVAGYHARNHVREGALKSKHGSGYIPKKVTGYHHTSRQGHRQILASQHFKYKGRFHGKQVPGEIWFTSGKHEGAKMALYGDYVVKTKVKRRHIAQHKPGWASTGPHGHNAWFSVHQSHLHGRRISNHYAPRKNPIHGTSATRRRARRIRR